MTDSEKTSLRRVATVLFTDIVGSTERLTELGDEEWHAVLRQHNGRVRAEIERHGGREISTAGDSFLAVFESPAEAIRCAIAAVESVRSLGVDIRAGMHTGEIVETESDVRGIAVHIGARVSSVGGAGEVLVSSTVRDLVRGSSLGFTPRGTFDLKGVPGRWQLFAVEGTAPDAGVVQRGVAWLDRLHPRTLAAVVIIGALLGVSGLYVILKDQGQSFAPRPAVAGSAAPGIAVLPFEVRGFDLDVWREGMVDLLSTGLDGAGGLRGISSRTVLARWDEVVPEDERADLATALEVATAAGARYALVGNVVSSGAEMRLSVDVYDIETGEVMGRAHVEGTPDNVMELADRLSIEILRILLRGEEDLPEVELESLMTSSPEALRAYLDGLVHFRHQDDIAARDAFLTAIKADSTFALAHYQMAHVYWLPLTRNPELRTHHLKTAMRLADRLPPREVLLLQAALALDRGFPDGISTLTEFVQLYPDDAVAWNLLGETYFHVPGTLGSVDEIEEAFTHAMEIDPRNAVYTVHTLDLALGFRADGIRAEELLSALEAQTGRTLHVLAGPVAMALAFGDSVSRERAVDSLDLVELPVVYRVSNYLYHPRYSEQLRHVVDAARRRGAKAVRSGASQFLFVLHALWRGDLREGLRFLTDPVVSDGERAELAYFAFTVGLPIPEDILDQALAHRVVEGEQSNQAVLAIGAYSADEERWGDHAAARTELELRADRALAEGDSVGWSEAHSLAEALEAYRAWIQGQAAAALPVFERTQPAHRIVRWWLGEVYLELSRTKDAERIFDSYSFWSRSGFASSPLSPQVPFTTLPQAQYILGGIREELDESDRARESYDYVVTYWEYADQALQPIVEDARRKISELDAAGIE